MDGHHSSKFQHPIDAEGNIIISLPIILCATENLAISLTLSPSGGGV